MDHKRFGELFHEFRDKLEEQHVLYLDCISGFMNINKTILEKQENIKLWIEDPEIRSGKRNTSTSHHY